MLGFEWESVYNELYSDDVRKQIHAVGRIRVWKSRVLYKLSASIDCTCGLIQAAIEDHNTINAGQVVEKDVAIRMGYSMAIVRFVNLITEKLQTRSFAQSVHRLADNLGVPEWMVNLRHEATHGSLPQLSILRSGVQFALAWLKREYWEAQNEWNDKEPASSSDSAVPLQQSRLEDILVTYMQQQYQVLDNPEDSLTKKERTAVERTINNLGKVLSYNSGDVMTYLLQEGYMIPAQNQLEALEIDEDDFVNSETLDLPWSLKKLWQPLVKKMDSLQLIEPFIQELLKEATGARLMKARVLNGWVHTIAQAASHRDGQGDYLVLSDPGSIKWQTLFDHCTEQPDVYNRKLLPSILKNLDTPLPEEKRQSILKLTDLMVRVAEGEERMETEEGVVTYSMDDLKKCHSSDKDVNSKTTNKVADLGTSSWQLCTDPIDWSKYPLGECPGITIDYSNLEIMKDDVTEDGGQDESSDDKDVSAVRSEPTGPVESSQWTEGELKNIMEEVDLM